MIFLIVPLEYSLLPILLRLRACLAMLFSFILVRLARILIALACLSGCIVEKASRGRSKGGKRQGQAGKQALTDKSTGGQFPIILASPFKLGFVFSQFTFLRLLLHISSPQYAAFTRWSSRFLKTFQHSAPTKRKHSSLAPRRLA